MLTYPTGATKIGKLSAVKWCHSRRNASAFHAIDSPPPKFSPSQGTKGAQKLYYSSEHKVKGFADYLTLISTDEDSHVCCLAEFDSKCSDLDLIIYPDMHVSFSICGPKVKDKFHEP